MERMLIMNNWNLNEKNYISMHFKYRRRTNEGKDRNGFFDNKLGEARRSNFFWRFVFSVTSLIQCNHIAICQTIFMFKS